jgi:DnaJ-class molecular chaperone
MKSKKDYYYVLNVKPLSRDDEIKKAYKEMAKKYHPDLNPGMRALAEEKMKQLTEAHDVLLDQGKKQEYDSNPIFQYKYPKLIDPVTKEIKIPKDKEVKKGPSFLDKIKKMMFKEPETPPPEPSALTRKAAERFSMALTYVEKKTAQMLEMAEVELKATLTEVPANYEALYDMGLIQYKLGNYEAAGNFFLKATRSPDNDSDAKKMLDLLSDEEM